MLVTTLREMERIGLVTRNVESVVLPTVEYRLTDLGLRFIEPVQLLYDCGRENADAPDRLQGGQPRRCSLVDTKSTDINATILKRITSQEEADEAEGISADEIAFYGAVRTVLEQAELFLERW